MAGVINIDEKETRARTMRLGLTHHEEDSNIDNGYVVYSSIYPEDPKHNYVRVLNMKGEEVHRWDMGDRRPGLWSYIPDADCTKRYRSSDEQKGFLLAITKLPSEEFKDSHEFLAFKSDCGGCIQLLEFDGKEIWTFKDEYQHHDARLTRKGNLIYLANEVMKNQTKASQVIKKAAERRGFKAPAKTRIYADVIKMVDPISKKLLFSWHVEDHLDPNIDVLNFNDPFDEWGHGNTIVPLYEDNNDPDEVSHVLVSFRQISSVMKIDVKTGQFERLLTSPFVSQQHDCSSLEEGNTNRILVFDNRYIPNDFAPSAFSRVVEYDLTKKEPCKLLPMVEGPKLVWMYVDGVCDFYSAYISGVQRLPAWKLEKDGVMYTLITEGMKGRIFLVKTNVTALEGSPVLTNKVIWEFVNPEIATGTNKDLVLGRSAIFRARYVPPNYFSEKQLQQMKQTSNTNNCELV